jgi:hypothetical protein
MPGLLFAHLSFNEDNDPYLPPLRHYDATRLQNAFRARENSPPENFIKAFPSSFSEFRDAFAYVDNKKYGPLYNDYEVYITVFFEMYFADKSGRIRLMALKKIVPIGMDAVYDPDAVNAFGGWIRAVIAYDTSSFCSFANRYKGSTNWPHFFYFLVGSEIPSRMHVEKMKQASCNKTIIDGALAAMRKYDKRYHPREWGDGIDIEDGVIPGVQ